MAATAEKLSLYALTAMVVGSMVGAGIFSLPRTFGIATGPVGAILAWCIAGGGMYMLARVFQFLAERKPELDAGVYAYAKAGFGHYPGFLSAFGYWVGSCIGNVSYWVLIKATLGAFFPIFGDGNTLAAVGISSVLLWSFHAMILRGITGATAINTIVTIAKIVPILLFILILILAFNAERFAANLWGGDALPPASLFDQVRATMLSTVFVFLGIEGASVYSRYAKERRDVGRATLLGFIGVLCLLVLVTLLPYAILDRADLAAMRQPSMAAVLEAVVGPWGAVFISAGLIISVMGAYLAWSLICAEVLFAAARTGDMPRLFATENARKVPSAALWLTNIVVQLFLISTLFSNDAFALMLNLTSSMSLVPYLLVALYAVIVLRADREQANTTRELVFAGIASLYTAFMIFAGGLYYLLLTAVLYAPGTALYVWARREQGQRVFTPIEWVIFAVAAVGAVIGIHGLATGWINV